MQTREISFTIFQGQIFLTLNTHICKGSFSWTKADYINQQKHSAPTLIKFILISFSVQFT